MPPPLDPHVLTLLDLLPQEGLDFGGLMEAIDRARYTGSVVIAFRNGRPQQINLGAPVKLAICQGVDTRRGSQAR